MTELARALKVQLDDARRERDLYVRMHGDAVAALAQCHAALDKLRLELSRWQPAQ